jgi:hypothetical protein
MQLLLARILTPTPRRSVRADHRPEIRGLGLWPADQPGQPAAREPACRKDLIQLSAGEHDRPQLLIVGLRRL